MQKVKVGVVGYGVIGQRLADGITLQGDMTLVGVSDVKPTLALRALREKGMPYNLYLASNEYVDEFKKLDIPITGTLLDMISDCDVILDSTPGGIGAKNKAIYEEYGKKAIFQGGEKNSVADVFFHGYANYENGVRQQFLKLTSCNTTGLIRSVDCLDKKFKVKSVAITIIRRVADPGDYHRGLTNALQIDKAPSHQALDLMTIMPHIDATGILVHTPVTHGHIITVVVTAKKKITRHDALNAFNEHPRIRIVNTDEGFLGNASLFRYARDLGNPRGDMYEIALWSDSVVEIGDSIMYAINVPQESVTIPETIDGVRAVMGMQTTSKSATKKTNNYLGIGKWKK
ncbi:MAG: type II glyceraldehyde-3-phosphate dehydrogenase [Christensenellaceae bacterium]|jgi:glyceraldehyde-3-phosphate dehydrogenase (NAD(P))|nr:type II glyceraldehyde-3-phosphate dehydrogenase [Christensenellaceae bacterium]